MRFVGVDLAWGGGNTGIAVIENGVVVFSEADKYTDDEIVKIIVKNKPCFVAIDAPLIVKNETGARPAEKDVAKKFMKYGIGAYPINKKIIEKYGGSRGEEIVSLLEREGFVHSPEIERKEISDKVFEVYPHPAIIRIFEIPRVLKYKKNKRELKTYYLLLKSLESKNPKLIFDKEYEESKRFEDVLDAIFCAYLAYYFWYFGKEGCEILGDPELGYILVPKLRYKLF